MTARRRKFVFDAERHLFFVDNCRWPGVSELLLAGGKIPARSLDFFTDEGRWRGTRVHKACLDFDLHRTDTSKKTHLITDAGYIDSYLKWMALVGMRWTKLEQARYSERFKFCGITDRIGFDGQGRAVVLDMKTGAKQSWHAIQLALYDILHDDLPWGVRRRITLYLQRDGSVAKTVEHTKRSDFHEALAVLPKAA